MFNVGDRVQAAVLHPSGNGSLCIGDQGTVCYPVYDGMISVRWDRNIGGHDCWGSCEYGYGWRVQSHERRIITAHDVDSI